MCKIKRDVLIVLFIMLFYVDVRPQQIAIKSSNVPEIVPIEVVTPEKFGCKGDNLTDDTNNFQKAIDYCKVNNRQLTSTKGKVYHITSPLDFSSPGEMQVDFGGAEIKAVKPMEYMIKYDNELDFSTRHNNIINNLVLDCNNISGGIYCKTAIKTSFNFIMIRNCSKKAFAVESGYEVFFTNSHIHCNTGKESYGIFLETGDSHFDNIAIIDAHTGVYQKTNGVNFFDKIHAWLYNNVEGSVFFDVSGLALLNQCYCDTAEKGYHINGFAILKMVNCQYYNNPDCYDSKNNPVIFSFATEDLSKSSSITCSNCDFNSGGLKAFICNYEKQRIQFEQCFIDPTIIGFLGKFTPIPSEGVSFNRAIGIPKDNNNYLQPTNDQSNYIYIDAIIESDIKSSEISIASLPLAYLPSNQMYGLGVFIWSDGSYTQGCVEITQDGVIKVRSDIKKTLKRIILDISYY